MATCFLAIYISSYSSSLLIILLHFLSHFFTLFLFIIPYHRDGGINSPSPPGGGGEAPLIFFFNILVYIYALNLAILFYKITFFPYNNIFDSFYNNFTNTNLSTTFLYTVEVQILISSHLSLSLTSLFYLPIITHYINNISLALSSF